MRIRTWVVASLVVQLLTFASGASAQSDDASTTTFLDFGVPCNDPLPESQLPKPLNGSVTPPSTDPTRPLSAPDFPPISRRLNEQGTAVMRLMVAETGEVSQAHIYKSTGSPRLDNAALEVTRGWRLRPGKVKGEPRCMWGKFAVTFELTDYARDELERVTVGPEARQLAHQLMGIEDLKKTLSTADSNAAAREMMDLAVTAALGHHTWVAAEDKVARILATEFTTDELAELRNFFASPVAAKWTSLTFKMLPEIMEQQGLVNQTLACSIFSVDRALKAKDPATVTTGGALAEHYRKAIPAFVEQSIPFCACLFNKDRRRVGDDGRTGTIGSCGLPPSLD